MKKLMTSIVVIVFFAVFFGCSNEDLEPAAGEVTLSITDAPLEDENLTGVWITVTGVEFHTSEGGWQTYEGAIPDEPVNLMELTNGATEVLGTDVPLIAGRYNQIRFFLDIQDTGDGVPTNPGCYLTFDEDSDPATEDSQVALFVPSGDTSGYKAVKSFTVPVNGSISVTADFDLRKAVVDAGTPQAPHYILKPTIRLVVDGEAGWIHGPVVLSDLPVAATSVVAYAYADGTWSDSETEEPIEETESRFENAITSAVACVDPDSAECSYKIPFLTAGVYDIAVALFDTNGSYIQMWGFYDNAEVIESKGTTVELSTDNLSTTLN